VDGRQVGLTPVVISDLEPGKHNVRVGCADEEELDVKAGGLTTFEVDFAP
jgi:hypothetical protein